MSEDRTSAPPGEGGSVRVVGTAHVSHESVRRVQEVVEEERPDVVAVELDESRYRQLRGDAPDDVDPKELLRGGMALQFLAYWLLSYVQARMGERFDIEPGAEMKAAVDAAERAGADVALVDRDIQVTVQRFWARMRLREKLRMVGQLAYAFLFGAPDDADELEAESMTDADVVSALMDEFRRFSPGGAEALIDERDAYIAHELVALRERGYHVVAVVGAGHREGVERYLERPEELPPMASLVGTEDGGFPWFKAVGALMGLSFLAFFALLTLAAVAPGSAFSTGELLRVFAAWTAFNGVLALGCARLAGAHWSSATVGGAAAPLTSLDPLVAPGWFAGYVELRHAPVNVADIGRLNEILADEEAAVRDLWRRMRQVPLFRLIAVVAMTNVGSFLGTTLFPVLVLPFLGGPFDSVAEIKATVWVGYHYGVTLLTGVVG